MEKKNSKSKIVVNILEWAGIIIFAAFAIFCLLFATQNPTSKSSGNVFGYETRLVVSASMEGEDSFYKDKNFSIGKIKTGSLVFMKSLPGDKKSDAYRLFIEGIKEGDVLTFTPQVISNEISITHRVIKIEKNNNVTYFTTKGDAPGIEAEETFPENNIIGKVTWTSHFLGVMYTNFFSNKPLIAVVILVPTLTIMGFEVYKIVKIVKEDKAEKALANLSKSTLKKKTNKTSENKTSSNKNQKANTNSSNKSTKAKKAKGGSKK